MIKKYRSIASQLNWHFGTLYFVGGLLVAIDLILPLFSKVLFDFVYREKQEHALNGVILGMTAFFIAQFALRSSYDFILTYIAQRMHLNLKSNVFSHIQSLPSRFLKTHSKGDLIVRLTDDTDRVLDLLLTRKFDLVFACLQILGISATCLWINSDVSIVLLVCIPFYLISSRYLFKTELGIVRDKITAQKSNLIEFIQLKLRQIAMIKAYDAEKNETKNFENLIRTHSSLVVQNRILQSNFSLNSNLSFDLWTVLVTWYFGRDHIRGLMSLGDLVALLILLGHIRPPMLTLIQLFGRYRAGMSSLRRIDEVLKWAPESTISNESQLSSSQLLREGYLQIRNLSFFYTEKAMIFHNLNITFRRHSYIALVGDNGAGKSTLIQLILGNEKAKAGQILLAGKDLLSYSRAELRKTIVSVDREQGIFPGTIRENISYGNQGATEGEIIRAARDAMLWDRIRQLPLGLDTVLTDESSLSHSEMRRLAIARALLVNPQILILDEVTADFDPLSDYLFQNSIRRMLDQRSVIAVAQHLSALRNADRILFLKEGRIVDDGDFNSLMKKNGEFFQYISVSHNDFSEFKKILDYENERSMRHETAYSLAVFRIEEFEDLTQQLSKEELARLNSDIYLKWIEISRKSDYVAMFKSGVYLVLLPELDASDVKIYQERAEDKMSSTEFRVRNSGKKFHFFGFIKSFNSSIGYPRSSEEAVEEILDRSKKITDLTRVA